MPGLLTPRLIAGEIVEQLFRRPRRVIRLGIFPDCLKYLSSRSSLALSPVFRYSIVTANLTEASFLALVGIGQMFPVASGEGGIDLSIPFVMNFCAFLAVQLITPDPVSVPLVLLLGIGLGIAVGLVNGIVVVRLRVAPIIGTLAVGFIVLTLVQLISASGDTTFADRMPTNLMRSQLLSISTPFYVLLAVAALAMIVVRRTIYGRTLLAVGQSRKAGTCRASTSIAPCSWCS